MVQGTLKSESTSLVYRVRGRHGVECGGGSVWGVWGQGRAGAGGGLLKRQLQMAHFDLTRVNFSQTGREPEGSPF